ncbi:hypothetical protein CYLTODRAFT_418530 [Cylindrobasidium torrendii FP15055 ss-10]|uniref:Uncharacterized protein n=1 Tax=Cylindrobasidium torrendii FP15055 ss-10 TaxID=1314674 RepID=A0A0D7BMN8_9AGAR|nr:hypothetical protein CYLTODRAFT_418530 [Cylindrobasidium torrendii FP15055 ss-10]
MADGGPIKADPFSSPYCSPVAATAVWFLTASIIQIITSYPKVIPTRDDLAYNLTVGKTDGARAPRLEYPPLSTLADCNTLS